MGSGQLTVDGGNYKLQITNDPPCSQTIKTLSSRLSEAYGGSYALPIPFMVKSVRRSLGFARDDRFFSEVSHFRLIGGIEAGMGYNESERKGEKGIR